MYIMLGAAMTARSWSMLHHLGEQFAKYQKAATRRHVKVNPSYNKYARLRYKDNLFVLPVDVGILVQASHTVR
jgi:hypothetical protein